LETLLASSLSIALYTLHPQGDSGGAELVAPGYSRLSITLVPVLNLCASNQDDLVWSASGTWGTATYFAICKTAGGEMIYWGSLPAPITASAGATPTIKAGSLLVDWTNPATGMAADWGAADDYAPPGDLGAVPLVNSMDVLTDLPSGVVSITDGVHTWLAVPHDHSALHFLSMVASQRLGTYLRWKAFDATRGSTAGYSVNGPTCLAF
jgi:hypothetical protein